MSCKNSSVGFQPNSTSLDDNIRKSCIIVKGPETTQVKCAELMVALLVQALHLQQSMRVRRMCCFLHW